MLMKAIFIILAVLVIAYCYLYFTDDNPHDTTSYASIL